MNGKQVIAAAAAAVGIIAATIIWAASRETRAPYTFTYQPSDTFSLDAWMSPVWLERMGETGWEEGTWPTDPNLADAAERAARWHTAAMEGGQYDGRPASRKVQGDWVTSRDTDDEGNCDNVTIRAAWPATVQLPDGGSITKTLIAWSANCLGVEIVGNGDTVPDETRRGGGTTRVSFVYEQNGHVIPEASAPWTVEVTVTETAAPTVAETSAVSCGKATLRTEVAAAFDLMCEAAARDGVKLEAVSGLRSAEEQRQRWEKLEADIGAEADKWVAHSETECASRHCAGEAVDVVNSGEAKQWLYDTIGCLDRGEIVPCGAGGKAVRNVDLYGFAASIPAQPWHLEWALPDSAPRVAQCQPPASEAVPERIADVWRCRMGLDGYSREQVAQVTAKAVAVSRCASGWQSNHLDELGRWASNADPVTGQLRDGRGVFSLSATQAAQAGVTWEELDGPVTSSHAAYELWKRNRQTGADGFAGFACADEPVDVSDAQW